MQKEPMAAEADIIDDKPEVVRTYLRKFNRTEVLVNKALEQLATIKDLTTKEEVDNAMSIMKDASAVVKKVDDKRLELTKPYRETVDKINAHAKSLTDKIPPAIQKGKDAVLAYQKEQERLALVKRKETRIAQLDSLGFTISATGYVNDGYEVPTRFIENLADLQWGDEIRLYERHLEKKRLEAIEALKSQKDGASFFGETDETESIDQQIEELEKAPAPAPVVKAHVPSFGGPSAGVKGVTKTWTHEVFDLSQVPREYLVLDPALVTKAIRDGVREIPGIKIYQKEGISLR